MRLSLQYDHIVPVSNRSVTARLPVAQLIRGDSLVKERLVKERTELKDLRAQDGGGWPNCGEMHGGVGFLIRR